jgi:hypothetical protein
MPDAAQPRCTRPWWRRPPVWVAGLIAILLIVFSLAGATGRPPAISYSVFLDQLDATNVASVVIHGTEIEGRLKQPLTVTGSSGTTSVEVFRSRMPDFGDPALLSVLRRQHVAVDVTWSSPWASWLGDSAPALLVIVGAILFAKPGLLIFGGLLVAGLLRAVRGNKTAERSEMSSNPIVTHPMHRMMKWMSGAVAKETRKEIASERTEVPR